MTREQAFARAFFYALDGRAREQLNAGNPIAVAALWRLIKLAGW